MVEGEKFFIVYSSNKVNPELELLLQGTENDKRIIAIGMGTIAAKNILAKGTPLSIVLVVSIDVFKYTLGKKENMADLLTEIAMDVPRGVATSAGTALAALLVVALPIEGILLPILLFGAAVVVLGISAAWVGERFLNRAGYTAENTHQFIVKHHIDIFVNKVVFHWEKTNYKNIENQFYGLKY